MTTSTDYLDDLLRRLSDFRLESGLTANQVEEQLILGTGWIDAVESGRVHPSLDVIAAMLSLYGKTLGDLANGLSGSIPHISRTLSASSDGGRLHIHFTYAKYDATYQLPHASLAQFTEILRTLRHGLAQLTCQQPGASQENAIKTESVARTFLKAMQLWPHANPSDIWWFLVYRAYCDPYNHPAEYSRMDFNQSWKRTGGWALERILEQHYSPILAKHGINLVIADNERKTRLLTGLNIGHRLEADKMDVLLTVGYGKSEQLIGVVHVKASFAERRTDDVPMSKALVDAGYISPLWTMDCKSSPASTPFNKGELGKTCDGDGNDPRSAKRKDIEDDRFFSACFSYNRNTFPTPDTYPAKARVSVCDFSSPQDAFTDFIIAERQRVKTRLGI